MPRGVRPVLPVRSTQWLCPSASSVVTYCTGFRFMFTEYFRLVLFHTKSMMIR